MSTRPAGSLAEPATVWRAARGSRAGTPTASLPAGTSRVTTAPAPVLRPLADLDRGDEHRVDADERAVADRRRVLAACRRSWR